VKKIFKVIFHYSGAFYPFYPCRGAQSAGWADAPQDASASSSDWPQLFERSGTAAQ
jgi:hypothetical protein